MFSQAHKDKYKDIFIVSSCGGHLTEVLALSESWDFLDPLYIINSIIKVPKDIQNNTLFVKHSERDLVFFTNLIEAIVLYQKYKPKYMLSTGAGIAVPFAIIGRLVFNIKIIYIESAASIFKPTLTGLIMRFFSDKFYIQSEHLKKYFPKAIFKGSLLS
tara:strand:- start:20 stop:496 length:477 start_codon:yes stop_codon:yes gene_type:complete